MTTADKIQAAVAYDITQGLKYADNSLVCDSVGNCMLQDSLSYCDKACRSKSSAILSFLRRKAAARTLKKEDLKLNNIEEAVKEDLKPALSEL